MELTIMPRLKIEISGDLFSAISDGEKAKITSILKNTDLLAQDGSLEIGDMSGIIDPQAAIADPQSIFDRIPGLCQIACDTAAAAAAAACTASTAGVGLAACLAATEIARNACRDAC
jgi:hypothetical protein